MDIDIEVILIAFASEVRALIKTPQLDMEPFSYDLR